MKRKIAVLLVLSSVIGALGGCSQQTEVQGTGTNVQTENTADNKEVDEAENTDEEAPDTADEEGAEDQAESAEEETEDKEALWDEEKKGAADVFSAAQTYVTDLYVEGKWDAPDTIDIADVAAAGLLESEPAADYVIYTTGEEDLPAISYVSWSSSNAPEDVTDPVYPMG